MTVLIANYCKIITNYDKNLLQITAVLLQMMTVGYYKSLAFIAGCDAHVGLSNSLLSIFAMLDFCFSEYTMLFFSNPCLQCC